MSSRREYGQEPAKLCHTRILALTPNYELNYMYIYINIYCIYMNSIPKKSNFN